MKPNVDRETLRALADEGNEKALDRLADLADVEGDVESSASCSTRARSTPESC